jgi:hypothetical protein
MSMSQRGPGMTCQEAIEHLLEFLEGGVGPDLKAAITKHMESCRLCSDLKSSYEKTASLCQKALRREVSGEVVDRLLAAIRARTGKS